ncbi:MAG: oligosaccharide flippase family protein [Gemmobacter sp.]
MLRSFAVILSGNASHTALGMLRSLLAAALISLEDFGIAATFMVAIAIMEMVSALGLKQQIVQAREGNDPDFQAALQGFQLLRGGVNALVLFLLAWPLAAFFGHPDLLWAYQVVALVPLIRAVEHFDVQRMARRMNYVPMLLASIASPLVSLLSIWPLYKVFGDFRVLLYALLIQAVTSAVVSHLLAERRYRLRFDRQIMAASLRFGWPLMLNGVLMFAIFHGDRMIVGRELGMVTLALFSMALSLTLAPASMLSAVIVKFFLPQLSAAKDDRPAFVRLSHASTEAHLVAGFILTIGTVLLGGPFLYLALGDKYLAAIPILVWVGIMQGIRVAKAASSTIALSQARTFNAALSNIPRVLMLFPAWHVVASGGDLVMLIWLGILGELVGFAIATGLAVVHLRLPVRPLLAPAVVSIVLACVAVLHALRQSPGNWWPDPVTGAALLVLLGLLVAASRNLRRYVARRELTRYDED